MYIYINCSNGVKFGINQNSRVYESMAPMACQQVICEVINKTSQGASDRRYQTVLVLKCYMFRGQSVSETWGRQGLGAPPLTRFNVEI